MPHPPTPSPCIWNALHKLYTQSIACLRCDWFISEITDGPDRAGHWTLNTQYNNKERLLDLAGSRVWRQMLINISVKKGFSGCRTFDLLLDYIIAHCIWHMCHLKTSARILNKKKGEKMKVWYLVSGGQKYSIISLADEQNAQFPSYWL